MSVSANASGESSRRITILQMLIGSIVIIGFGWLKGQWSAISALYGVAIAMFIARILAKSIKIATDLPVQQTSSAMAVLYVGAVVRFVLVIILLGVGLWRLNLDPVPMLSGFAVVQLGYPLLVRKQR